MEYPNICTRENLNGTVDLFFKDLSWNACNICSGATGDQIRLELEGIKNASKLPETSIFGKIELCTGAKKVSGSWEARERTVNELKCGRRMTKKY